jgi:lipopolysaccharide export system protein LptA
MKYFFAFVMIFFAPFVHAQEQTPSPPLEISADQALEWDRANTRYFARQNALAKQGDFELRADLLTADYRDTNGRSEIYRITAIGNVRMNSGTSIATGGMAVYTVDDGKVVLSESPVITSEQDRLTAERITAFIVTDKTGKRVLDRAEADGNVVITTPNEKATSKRGVYNARANTVELMDNVVLTQGANTLTGARATMNLTTKLSRMEGAKNGSQRVKGVFYTGAQSPVSPVTTDQKTSSP